VGPLFKAASVDIKGKHHSKSRPLRDKNLNGLKVNSELGHLGEKVPQRRGSILKMETGLECILC